MSKILHFDSRLIEIYLPIQTNTGAKLIVCIRNSSSDKDICSTIVNTIRNSIGSGLMAKVTYTLFKFGVIRVELPVVHVNLCVL